MNNLELTSVLEVAVFGMAIAQALTILLTLRRERDVKDLRELVEDQRLRLIELRAWLAGRNASRTRQIASGRQASPESSINADAAASRMPMQRDNGQHINEDAAARAVKALEWEREVAARLQAGIKTNISLPQPAAAPTDRRSSMVEDGFKWFREDHNEPPEITEAREILAGSKMGPSLRALHSVDSVPRPSTADEELGRITRAVDQLKEDAEKVSLMSRVTRPSAER